jgi:hypothetical protein
MDLNIQIKNIHLRLANKIIEIFSKIKAFNGVF